MRALSPLLIFLALYLGVSLAAGDFYKVPVTVAFLLSSVYAVAIAPGKLEERIGVFSRGAGSPTVLLMAWIYLLAGAFATLAKTMGAVDATVHITMSLLPAGLLLPGLFVAACFISLAIGTSVGTIAALTPVAVGIATEGNFDMAMTVAVVAGGAFFGDNLSFISDTTIAATQTLGCRMRDKFRTNLSLVSPAAIAAIILYAVIGARLSSSTTAEQVVWSKVLPYLVVITTAVCGVNVMFVLLLGIVLAAAIGLMDGSLDIWSTLGALGDGMASMGELIIMALLASGLFAMIHHMGGIDRLVHLMTHRSKSARTAEGSIALLTALINVCTANNTVTLLTVGPIARDIAKPYGIAPRRTASLIDTTSCAVQGLLPYSAQLLVASSLVGTITGQALDPLAVIPMMFYPMGIGLMVLSSIIVRQFFVKKSTPKA